MLQKPLLHLHTQFNRELPWSTIDMDFMNLNQSAHGDREFGFIGSRMRLARKVVVGHWQDEDVHATVGVVDARGGRAARCADRARSPASATTCARSPSPKATRSPPRCGFGYSVNGYGLGDLVAARRMRSATRDVDELCGQYDEQYVGRRAAAPERRAAAVAPRRGPHRAGPAPLSRGRRLRRLHRHVRKPARPQAAARHRRAAADGRRLRLRRRGRLEGGRAACGPPKVMAAGLPGGTSFMEDYTYHLEPERRAGAGRPHAGDLPVDRRRQAVAARFIRWASAARKTRCGWCSTRRRARRSTRRSSTWATASAWCVNEVDVVAPPEPLKKLPVARAVWDAQPDLQTAAARLDSTPAARTTRLQPGRHHRASRRLRRNGRRRAGGDRRRHVRANVQENPPLERGVLPLSATEFCDSLRQVVM